MPKRRDINTSLLAVDKFRAMHATDPEEAHAWALEAGYRIDPNDLHYSHLHEVARLERDRPGSSMLYKAQHRAAIVREERARTAAAELPELYRLEELNAPALERAERMAPEVARERWATMTHVEQQAAIAALAATWAGGKAPPIPPLLGRTVRQKVALILEGKSGLVPLDAAELLAELGDSHVEAHQALMRFETAHAAAIGTERSKRKAAEQAAMEARVAWEKTYRTRLEEEKGGNEGYVLRERHRLELTDWIRRHTTAEQKIAETAAAATERRALEERHAEERRTFDAAAADRAKRSLPAEPPRIEPKYAQAIRSPDENPMAQALAKDTTLKARFALVETPPEPPPPPMAA